MITETIVKEKLNPKNKKAAVFMLRPLFITIIQLINKFRQATRHDRAPKNWSQCGCVLNEIHLIHNLLI